MSEDTGRKLLITTFLGAVFFLTWQELKAKRLPRPQRYVGAGVIWGVLGLTAPVITYPLAGMFGLAMFVALLYQTLSNPVAQVGTAGGEASGGFIANATAGAVGSAGGNAAGNFLSGS